MCCVRLQFHIFFKQNSKRKNQKFDGGYLRERSWFQVIQKIFRVFQNPHVIYATTRVNSFTIFLFSLNIPSGKESENLPYLYWIPKLQKTPYKERYIAGSSTCSTEEFSINLTKILSSVKEGKRCYLCLIHWLGIRSNMIYIQTRYCWKPCPQER
jgi:hypothetical protein